MARTEQDSERRRNGRLVGAAKISGKLAEWCWLQRKNLNILALPKSKGWPQRPRVSSWRERQSRPCQNKKKHPLPGSQIVRWEIVQVSEKKRDRSETVEGKGLT